MFSKRQKTNKNEDSIYHFYFECTEKAIKQYGPNTVVWMQVGSFYEIYGLKKTEHSEITHSIIQEVSQICNFSIANKSCLYNDHHLVMAGVPESSADKYMQLMIQSGITVCLYVQKTTDGLKINRVLDAVYSPGTYIPYDMDTNVQLSNNIMCIWFHSYKTLRTNEKRMKCGMSSVNIFTGESSIFEYETAYYMNPTSFDELERYVSITCPSEVIIISNFDENIINTMIQYSGLKVPMIHKICIDTEKNIPKLEKVNNCSKQNYINHILSTFFGEEVYDICQEFRMVEIATQSFCYLMNFIQEHNPDIVKKMSIPIFNNTSTRMVLANHTLKQLNIIDDHTLDSKKSMKLSSVLSFLSRCKTNMGKRKFQYQLTNPVFDEEWLNMEYNMIELLLLQYDDFIPTFQSQLKQISDMEKISRQIITKKIYPSSIYFLYDSIRIIQQLNVCLYENKQLCDYLCDVDIINGKSSNQYIEDICVLIMKYIDSVLYLDKCADIKTNRYDKNIIKPGISKSLDTISTEYSKNIDLFCAVHSFFNNIMKESATDEDIDYVRVHTTEKSGNKLQITKKRGEILKKKMQECAILQEGEKVLKITSSFIIPLKDIRLKHATTANDEIEFPQLDRTIKHIIELKDKMSDEIAEVFSQFLRTLQNEWYDKIDILIQYISKMDILQTKTFIAREYNYCKPVIDNSREHSFFQTTDLRHVLIEHLQQNEIYITNDCALGSAEDKNGILLFGTNAVGKTSFIRAIGIVVIMAQAGMYVPASSFLYKPYHSIFSRILGNDNIFKGLSTFSVEMSELRIILKMADENSLILGDELCSGTETESALSIFTTGLIELHEKKSTFLFATHFHEITKYEEIQKLNKLAYKHMSIKYDREKDILIYERKLKDGSGSRVYGLEVCKSLYMGDTFIEKAYEIRNKYFPEVRGELAHSSSVYNSTKIRGLCEICKETIAAETHHLFPQKDSDENGYIGSFHKNHHANLASVCTKCHDKIHSDEKKTGIVGIRRKKTTNGYQL